MAICANISDQSINDEDAQCFGHSILDNMQDLNVFQPDDSSFIFGSVSIGDVYADQLLLEFYVKGAINASNFLHFYPLMSFQMRDQIAQRILDAANVDSKGAILILKAVPIYVSGQDDFIDVLGNAIVLERFYMMLKMESTMWVLSTLGGGYSAMADCGLRRCAESALSISKRQLKVAKSIGDEVLLVRCNIYIGFALAQLGKIDEAFQTLMYCRSLTKDLKSSLLQDLCSSLYMKIKCLGAGTKTVKSQKFQKLSSLYE